MANVPITSLPEAGTVAKTDQLIVQQGGTTQRATLAKVLADLGVINPDTAQDDMLLLTTPDGAAAHNCVYRGKNLGSSVTSEQWAAIKAGTFRGLYLGDYWTISSIEYIIAGFNYWLNTGDAPCTQNHPIVVPKSTLYSLSMNDTATVSGGYVGSQLYKTGLEQAKTMINNAFGSAHILSHREYLVNAVAKGKPTGTDWYDSTVELMNENMVYGGRQFSPMLSGEDSPWDNCRNYTVDKSQLPLFRVAPWLIRCSNYCWLRDVVSTSNFATVGNRGDAAASSANANYGVRPIFGLIG